MTDVDGAAFWKAVTSLGGDEAMTDVDGAAFWKVVKSLIEARYRVMRALPDFSLKDSGGTIFTRVGGRKKKAVVLGAKHPLIMAVLRIYRRTAKGQARDPSNIEWAISALCDRAREAEIVGEL